MKGIRRAVAMMAMAAALAVGGQTAEAQLVPQFLVHQGRLTDRAGVPVRGSQNITYRIYASPMGGTALWSETLSVMFDEGYFSVQLGDTMPFPPTLFDGSPRYLGVTVGADPEMTPRQLIGSVPYALVAGNAVGDITPRTVVVGGRTVIDAMGRWVGPTDGLIGPAGPAGPPGPPGPAGPPGPSSALAGCANGVVLNGVCLLGSENVSPGSDWNTASITCAGLGGDLCSATQYWALRRDSSVTEDLFYTDSLGRRAVWSKHFSDNDMGRISFLLQSHDDPDPSFRYGYACCGLVTPSDILARARVVRPMGAMNGIPVTWLNTREETTATSAARICASLRSDLCSTAQYVVLNDAGLFSASTRRLTNHVSDNDGLRFSSILGTNTADNPAWNNAYAFACCGSNRPQDNSCPAPGMRVNNVCMMEAHETENATFFDAARACAALGADICSNSQMQNIRNSGRFAGRRAWTNNGADNDSNRVGGLLPSMPDNPDPSTDRFGYACCL